MQWKHVPRLCSGLFRPGMTAAFSTEDLTLQQRACCWTCNWMRWCSGDLSLTMFKKDIKWLISIGFVLFFLFDWGLAALSLQVAWSLTRSVSISYSEPGSWSQFYIHSLPQFVLLPAPYCCPQQISIAYYLPGACLARRWFPGKGHLLCCIHLLGQKLSEEELESLSQSALCCFTLCELKHDFSKNPFKGLLVALPCLHNTLEYHQRCTAQHWFTSLGYTLVFFL